jgi:hypothetical protein
MSAWTKFATQFFHQKQKQNPDFKFSQALKQASPLFKKMKKGGSSKKQRGGEGEKYKISNDGNKVECLKTDPDSAKTDICKSSDEIDVDLTLSASNNENADTDGTDGNTNTDNTNTNTDGIDTNTDGIDTNTNDGTKTDDTNTNDGTKTDDTNTNDGTKTDANDGDAKPLELGGKKGGRKSQKKQRKSKKAGKKSQKKQKKAKKAGSKKSKK